MSVDECVHCRDFPCADVDHSAYVLPALELDPTGISLLLISEAAPASPDDWFYASGEEVSSLSEQLERCAYVTIAVKCGKTGYAIKTDTVETCSQLLEHELALFAQARVLMLMGDLAIKPLNAIARRNGEPRVIPAGSTYKLRGPEYRNRGLRVSPSYLQAGPSFFIEKSKRKMIAEEIAAALEVVRRRP